MTQELKQKIEAQAINEINHARTFKQSKIKNWQKNEDMYYGKKSVSSEARANVDLGRMQEFVHTLLSKIDNPLVFKYAKRKESQLRRVDRLNSLRAIDQVNDFWDIKDLVGKKQGIIYGRAIYSYYADSINGYAPHLDNIDVYDFLIDPSAGGLDIEKAMFLGNYGVIKTRSELEEGKGKLYDETTVDRLLQGTGNNTEITQEETNKTSRTQAQSTTERKELQSDDKFKFWNWYTTYDGIRYYMVFSEKSGSSIEIKPLKEVCESNLWPFWTWAAFPDLTEFWTPSYCDYVREIFMAQYVSINQMLDNAEAINKPQKVVNVNAIENMAELKYRRDGVIKIKGDFDANKAVQTLNVPSINTPILVFNTLEAIQEKASGVTSIAKGVSDEEGKVGIYEGNQEALADRFGLLNKSYSFGYNRFALLYMYGVKEHLTKKVAIEILGPDGVDIERINRNDIFRKNDDFRVIIESSTADKESALKTQGARVAALAGLTTNPNTAPKINMQKAIELQLSTSGFNEDEIRQILDVESYGDREIMSEADRDIEDILDGNTIRPNANANNAYKQRFVDYIRDHQEDISPEQFNSLTFYLDSLEPVIIQNEQRAITQFETDMVNQIANMPPTMNGKPPQVAGAEGGPISGRFPQLNNQPLNEL